MSEKAAKRFADSGYVKALLAILALLGAGYTWLDRCTPVFEPDQPSAQDVVALISLGNHVDKASEIAGLPIRVVAIDPDLRLSNVPDGEQPAVARVPYQHVFYHHDKTTFLVQARGPDGVIVGWAAGSCKAQVQLAYRSDDVVITNKTRFVDAMANFGKADLRFSAGAAGRAGFVDKAFNDTFSGAENFIGNFVASSHRCGDAEEPGCEFFADGLAELAPAHEVRHDFSPEFVDAFAAARGKCPVNVVGQVSPGAEYGVLRAELEFLPSG